MNLGLRCGQMMAERMQGMNIIERSSWHYRFGGQMKLTVIDHLEGVKKHPEIPERLEDILNQLCLGQQNLRKTLYDTLKKKDNVKKETYGYR